MVGNDGQSQGCGAVTSRTDDGAGEGTRKFSHGRGKIASLGLTGGGGCERIVIVTQLKRDAKARCRLMVGGYPCREMVETNNCR
jgi:hypothetical protein